MIIDFLQTTLLVLAGIYGFGDMARQNAKFDNFVSEIELGYASFNMKLANLEVREALITLGKWFGWLTILLLLVIMFLRPTIHSHPSLYFWINYLLLAFAVQWASIRWCLNHKKSAHELGRTALMIISTPILIGLLEILSGISMTDPLRVLLAQTISSEYIANLAIVSGPLKFGSLISCFMLIGFVFYYCLFWVLTIPVVFATGFLITSAVKFAKLVNLIAPKTPFQGFVICLFVIVSFSTLEIWQKLTW